MKIDIFKPAQVDFLQLKNRISMAPMTRARNADGIPGLRIHGYIDWETYKQPATV